MKKHSLALTAAVLLLFSCENPYMVQNLERPVYLTNIEIRSDRLAAEDPSHPLDQTFQETQTSYTVTVPWDAGDITVTGYPETGAMVSGETFRTLQLTEQTATFTFTVYKQYRRSTVYTVLVQRGLPEAQLAGLDLYIGDHADPANWQDYDPTSYILNFVPARSVYTIKVPRYTDHIALILRSYTDDRNKLSGIKYEFKNWEGNTIGPDGKTASPGYCQDGAITRISQPPLPSWYPGIPPGSTLSGNIHSYPGRIDGNPSWFGKDFEIDTENPRGRGRTAKIMITVSSEHLSDKTYLVELERELDAAYLSQAGIFVIEDEDALGTNDVFPAAPPPGLPESTGGRADMSKNRLTGNFSGTVLNYEAALPNIAKAVRVRPVPDRHIKKGTLTYRTYYYDAQGKRYYIDGSGSHREHPVQFEDPPNDDPLPNRVESPWDDDSLTPAPEAPPPVDLYYNISDGAFQFYVRMEVVILVQSESYFDRVYRIRVIRQKDRAALNYMAVVPHEPANPLLVYPGDGNVFGTFRPSVNSYTVNVDAGRSRARLHLYNGDSVLPVPPDPAAPPAGFTFESVDPGSSNRTITVRSGDRVLEFRKVSASPIVWQDGNNVSYADAPWVDVELKNRNTVVTVQVSDAPNFADEEYTLNLLSKTRYDITLPQDGDNNGRVRAVFADGDNRGLTAGQALPGEKIRITVDANLGYYVDWGNYGGADHSAPLAGDTYNGVTVTASIIAMGPGGVTFVATPPQTNPPIRYWEWKHREYEFYMPDENVQFEVNYRPTTTAVNNIAYVAAEARRGGGYESGGDEKTATSWGTASNDLQAVINSYKNGNFSAIWVLQGTYTPPDPDTYTPAPNETGLCFSSAPYTASKYQVPDYALTGLNKKEDIAFVLRPQVKIYGGFLETDNHPDDRKDRTDAAAKTILSGEFSDGTRAHHVMLAADAGSDVILDTFTITGGIGPEADSNITAAYGGGTARSISRQRGGGIYNVHSGIKLENVIIRNNKSTRGGGMYTVSTNVITRPVLNRVTFFGNTALENGGGMYNLSSGAECSPRIENSLFEENKSVDRGGGIYNDGPQCKPEIAYTVFRSNSASDGGGIYTGQGESAFSFITVEDNWTSGAGSGIYNASNALFFNLTVRDNVSKGGSGVGIYNAGVLTMTNATLEGNKRNAGGPSGGGLCNLGSAVLGNVTIRGNSASSGGGIYNGGQLVLVNCMVTGNEAGYGGGITNAAMENGVISALLVNTSVTGNESTSDRGGGIYNYYEGSAESILTRTGSVNVMLTNTRITGNSGGAVFNHYFRYSGKGINLTMNNATIADNDLPSWAAAVYTWKDTSQGNDPLEPDPLAAGAAEKNRKAFPVFIRFHNTVVYGHSGRGSAWAYGGSPGGSAFIPAGFVTPGDMETYHESGRYSLIEGKGPADIGPGPGVLDGAVVNPGFHSDYRPGSSLVDRGSSALYPPVNSGPDTVNEFLLDELYWKTGGRTTGATSGTGIVDRLFIPVFTGGNIPMFRAITEFLRYDNSFNRGDLRAYNGNEGPHKNRLNGPVDIGAYEQ